MNKGLFRLELDNILIYFPLLFINMNNHYIKTNKKTKIIFIHQKL